MPTSPPLPTLYDRLGGRPHLRSLLRHFYADVRQHHEIGPIFSAQIADWPAHEETIADFWSGITGGPATYSGPMPMKHLFLGLKDRHFAAWLDLWHRHCRAHLPANEAAELIAYAEKIGERLRQIVGAGPAGRR